MRIEFVIALMAIGFTFALYDIFYTYPSYNKKLEASGDEEEMRQIKTRISFLVIRILSMIVTLISLTLIFILG